MTTVNWGLMQPVDVGARFQAGFDRGQQQGERARAQSALVRISSGRGSQSDWNALHAINPQMAMAMQDQQYQNKERARTGEFRNALADTLMAGHSSLPAAMPPAPMPGDGGPTAGAVNAGDNPNALGVSGATPPQAATAGQPNALAEAIKATQPLPSARERAIRADPEAYVTAQSNIAQMNNRQLETMRELNDFGMQVLGSVQDQASYDRGRAAVAQMWQRYGIDPSLLDQLPAMFSPEAVEQMRMQGMDTSRQLQAVARERRLDWDIEDDRIDNESIDDYRQGQLSNTRRGQDLTHQRGIRGQDVSSRDRRRGQDIGSRDRVRGQDVGSRDRRRGQDVRGSGSGRGAGRASAPANAPIARGPDGRRYTVRNGRWVPIG